MSSFYFIMEISKLRSELFDYLYKYLKEYRVRNTNISKLKNAKKYRIGIQI